MSTLFIFFASKVTFLGYFCTAILPLNTPPPFGKFHAPGHLLQTIRCENNNLHLQLFSEIFCCCFVVVFLCFSFFLFSFFFFLSFVLFFVTCEVVWWQQFHNGTIKTFRIIVNLYHTLSLCHMTSFSCDSKKKTYIYNWKKNYIYNWVPNPVGISSSVIYSMELSSTSPCHTPTPCYQILTLLSSYKLVWSPMIPTNVSLKWYNYINFTTVCCQVKLNHSFRWLSSVSHPFPNPVSWSLKWCSVLKMTVIL